MGDWGKISGALLGTFAGPFATLLGGYTGDKIENAVSGDNSKTPPYFGLNDPKADTTASDNQLLIAQTNAITMELGIRESSKTAQFQTTAWLTDRLDSESTKLQTAQIDAKVQFTKESDRHVEKMAEYRNKFTSHETHGGLPPPDEN